MSTRWTGHDLRPSHPDFPLRHTPFAQGHTHTYLYTCVRRHTHTKRQRHTYPGTYSCPHVHTQTHVPRHTLVSTRTHTDTRTQAHTRVHTYPGTHSCPHVHTHVCTDTRVRQSPEQTRMFTERHKVPTHTCVHTQTYIRTQKGTDTHAHKPHPFRGNKSCTHWTER